LYNKILKYLEIYKIDKIKKENKIYPFFFESHFYLAKSKRGSKFRGVSKNGNQWQVLIMINKKKMYIGSFATEEEAAKNYDYVAIRYHGSKAKTNFLYSEEEINSFLLN